MPLSVDEVQELYLTNAAVTETDEREVGTGLPSLDIIPVPDTVAELIADATRLRASDTAFGAGFGAAITLRLMHRIVSSACDAKLMRYWRLCPLEQSGDLS